MVFWQSGLANALDLDGAKLATFLRVVEEGYPDNAYHNSLHAADVAQGMFHFLYGRAGGGMLAQHLDRAQQFAALLATLVHDIGHLGLNNGFLTATSHELALTYLHEARPSRARRARASRAKAPPPLALPSPLDASLPVSGVCGVAAAARRVHARARARVSAPSPLSAAQSPLERMHCAMAFRILARPDADMLAAFPAPAEKAAVRKTMVSLVLATDMAMHGTHVAALESLTSRHSDAAVADTLAKEPDKLELVLQMALHAADISNPAKPWAVSLRWTECVLEEFFAQGDEEKAVGLPVTPGFDRAAQPTWKDRAKGQAFFLGVLVKPLFEALGKVPGMEIGDILENLDRNLTVWKEVLATGEVPAPTPAPEAAAAPAARPPPVPPAPGGAPDT